jgi:hypothetical protein
MTRRSVVETAVARNATASSGPCPGLAAMRLKSPPAIAHSNFETAKELGWFEIERNGDPDSQLFSQIRNLHAQRIRNNPHRPQRDVPLSPLDSSNVRPVQTRTVRKFVLRPSLSSAQFPDSRPDCSARIRLPSGHRRALSNSSSASSVSCSAAGGWPAGFRTGAGSPMYVPLIRPPIQPRAAFAGVSFQPPSAASSPGNAWLQ